MAHARLVAVRFAAVTVFRCLMPVFLRHDSFLCVRWRILVCDMTYVYGRCMSYCSTCCSIICVCVCVCVCVCACVCVCVSVTDAFRQLMPVYPRHDLCNMYDMTHLHDSCPFCSSMRCSSCSFSPIDAFSQLGAT